jgi:glucosylceramidase
MHRPSRRLSRVCFALFVASCNSASNPPGGSGGSEGGGTGGSSFGGAAGEARGGSSGSGGAWATGGSGMNAGGGGSGGGPGGQSTIVESNGGSGGERRGGDAVGNGGRQAGGAQGSGGSSGTGGSTGTGGTTVASTLVTSSSSAYWQTGTWTESSASATVTVDEAKTYQTWEGFGGAFNELGWSYLTSKSMQDEAIQLLFGDDGCRFAWGRIPMGASDYAVDRYTLDESSGDNELTKFSIERDKQKLIPYIKAAQAKKKDLRFWASPWTPPTWMKNSPYQTPGNPVNAFDGGSMKSDEVILKAHAQYFVKFVKAYADEGIAIEVVAPQNEPNYSQNYPSCIWSASTFTTFIKSHLGPALASAAPTVKIMLGTMSNNGGSADVAVANAVLADATAKSFCKVMGVQWGMSDANQISNLKSKGGDIPIWLSEHKCGGNPGSNVATAPNDINYAKDSWGWIRDAIKNGLTAYNTWNMVLDKGGKGIDNTRVWAQNALLVADSGSITKTPVYHVFRHLSQFVEPGAKRIDATGGDAVAFKNPDGSLVAVMYNSGSGKDNYVVAMGGKKLQFAMPGSGWATVRYKP